MSQTQIVYSARNLKAGEQRATMGEAITAGKVRFWGIQSLSSKQMCILRKEEAKDKIYHKDDIFNMKQYILCATAKLLRLRKQSYLMEGRDDMKRTYAEWQEYIQIQQIKIEKKERLYFQCCKLMKTSKMGCVTISGSERLASPDFKNGIFEDAPVSSSSSSDEVAPVPAPKVVPPSTPVEIAPPKVEPIPTPIVLPSEIDMGIVAPISPKVPASPKLVPEDKTEAPTPPPLTLEVLASRNAARQRPPKRADLGMVSTPAKPIKQVSNRTAKKRLLADCVPAEGTKWLNILDEPEPTPTPTPSPSPSPSPSPTSSPSPPLKEKEKETSNKIAPVKVPAQTLLQRKEEERDKQAKIVAEYEHDIEEMIKGGENATAIEMYKGQMGAQKFKLREMDNAILQIKEKDNKPAPKNESKATNVKKRDKKKNQFLEQVQSNLMDKQTTTNYDFQTIITSVNNTPNLDEQTRDKFNSFFADMLNRMKDFVAHEIELEKKREQSEDE
jgi:hypothetical protein